jgi:hypothetical protein
MIQKDIAIEQYKALGPHKFSFLRQLTLSQDAMSEDALSLTLELLSDEDKIGELHLLFFGVQQLKMNIERDYLQMKIEISSMREAQWEHLKYFIKAEDNQLSFYCKRFEIKLVDAEIYKEEE